MEFHDYIMDEASALKRLNERRKMSVVAWVYCSPFIAGYIKRRGWTIRGAATELGRSKSDITALNRIAGWPEILRSRVVQKADSLTVKDVFWLCRRKEAPSATLERIDLHVSGASKIPSRYIQPKYRLVKAPAQAAPTADAQYITEQIRASMVLGVDSVSFNDLDVPLMREVLRRLGLRD